MLKSRVTLEEFAAIDKLWNICGPGCSNADGCSTETYRKILFQLGCIFKYPDISTDYDTGQSWTKAKFIHFVDSSNVDTYTQNLLITELWNRNIGSVYLSVQDNVLMNPPPYGRVVEMSDSRFH